MDLEETEAFNSSSELLITMDLEETEAFNASTEWLITMDHGSRFQFHIVRGKNDYFLYRILQGRIMKNEECLCCDFLRVAFSLTFYSNRYFITRYLIYDGKDK